MFSKVNSMSKYAPTIVAYARARMSKFLMGVFEMVVKKWRTIMIIAWTSIVSWCIHKQIE